MEDKLIRKLQETDLFEPPSEGDLVKRQEIRKAEKQKVLRSFELAFPGAKFTVDPLFSENEVIGIPSESVDENGIPLYDQNEEIDYLMRDASQEFGFKTFNTHYENGIAKKLLKWGEQNNISFEPYSSYLLIGYWAN